MAKNVSLGNSDVTLGNAWGPDPSTAASAVRFDDWYEPKRNGGVWTFVARLNDASLRHIYAQTMIDACNNNNVCYSMNNRTEVYNWIKNNNYAAISTLQTRKYCDCSSLASALLLYIGIDIGQPTTYGFRNAIEKTGKFTIFDDPAHVSACNNLFVGDIIVYRNNKEGVGHAAVVVYSEYDNTTEEYVDKPTSERDVCYGRVTVEGDTVSNGPVRVNPSQAPVNLCELSDFELFLLGAYITGGGAATFKAFKSAKSVDEQPIA